MLRNALAHNSRYALKRLEDELLSPGVLLRPRERNPVGYLRSTHAGSSTFFDYYVTRLLVMAQQINL